MNRLNRNTCKEIFDIYNRALLNEIQIDEVAFIETGLDLLVDFKTVRTYHVQELVKKHPNIVRTISVLMIFFWKPINFSIQTLAFFKAIFVKITNKRKAIISMDKVLAIATPRLLPQLKKIKDKSIIPQIYLLVNTKAKDEIPDGSIYLTHFATLADIIKAYKMAVLFPFYFKHTHDKVHDLQTYTSFNWFLSYNILSKLQIGELWFGNHYDRWAILFDSLEIQQKVIVQHGIENGLSVYSKLKNIDHIYLIDETQHALFVDKIVTSLFSYELLESKLNLKKILPEENLKVLIVGNVSLCQHEEKLIISRLSHLKKLSLVVKPHPVLSMKFYENLSADYQFYLIKDKDLFPDVDIVVSYNSTLAIEYAQLDKKVIYYAENKIEAIIEIIIDILSQDTSK